MTMEKMDSKKMNYDKFMANKISERISRSNALIEELIAVNDPESLQDRVKYCMKISIKNKLIMDSIDEEKNKSNLLLKDIKIEASMVYALCRFTAGEYVKSLQILREVSNFSKKN